MKDTYQKCISLFSEKNSRVLIITNENCQIEPPNYEQGIRTIDMVSSGSDADSKILNRFRKDRVNEGDNFYDLIILDQVRDSPLLQAKLSSVWQTSQEMFIALSEHTTSQGNLIVLTKNKINLRSAFLFFSTLICFFKRIQFSSTFIAQYSRELKEAGFQRIDCFYVFPDFNSFAHLISDERNAFLGVFSHKYGLPSDIHRRPRYWLPWLAVWIRFDRWLLCSQLLWARK